MKQKGFTISEILLTLAVVGVIAAMVVPGLVGSSNNRELEVAFKKVYAELNSAVSQITLEEGGNLTTLHTAPSTGITPVRLAQYLKTIKICNSPTAPGNCWHSSSSDWKTLDGSNNGFQIWEGLVLKSGAFVGLPSLSSNCQWDGYRINGQDQGCAIVYVDVNGFNKPNRWGRDIFTFVTTRNDGLYPDGGILTNKPTLSSWCDMTSNSTDNGIACAGRIFRNGKMDY